MNKKIPELLFDALEEVMQTRDYHFNSDIQSVDEYNIENVSSIPPHQPGKNLRSMLKYC